MYSRLKQLLPQQVSGFGRQTCSLHLLMTWILSGVVVIGPFAEFDLLWVALAALPTTEQVPIGAGHGQPFPSPKPTLRLKAILR